MFYAEFPMFHVEHMMILRTLALFLMVTSLFGCNKPNPNPELADEIYQDLNTQAQSAQRDLESEKKKLEGLKKDVETAIPQTGAIKFAQKHYFEAEARIRRLEQLQKYYELKAEARRRYTKTEYAKAFRAGKPWPTSDELEAYKQYKVSSVAEKGWDTKKRVKEYEKAHGIISQGSKSPEKSEKKAETAEKSE